MATGIINRISDKVVHYAVNNNALDCNDMEMVKFCKYGIEITLSSILNIVLIFVCSLICGTIVEGLIFLCVFIPIRQFTGGYHASTYFKCNLTFLLGFLGILLLNFLICNHVSTGFVLILQGAGTILIFFLCPIENKLKPFRSDHQRKKCKLLGTLIFGVDSIIACWLVFKGVAYGFFIALTLQFILVLVIAAIIKERIEAK